MLEKLLAALEGELSGDPLELPDAYGYCWFADPHFPEFASGEMMRPLTDPILCAFPDNGVGIIEASWDLPRNFEEVEVFGNLGSVDMTSNSAGELIKFEAYVGREKREIVQVALAEDHRDPATYFAKAVRTGKLEDFVSAEFHMDVMEILEAAQRSAENGRPVTLPLR